MLLTDCTAKLLDVEHLEITNVEHKEKEIMLEVRMKRRASRCPLSVRESVEEMHAAYRALGGNGAIDHIVAEMNELPTVKKEDNIR